MAPRSRALPFLLSGCFAILCFAPDVMAQPAKGGPPEYPVKRFDPRKWEAKIKADVFGQPFSTFEKDPLYSPRAEIIIPIGLKAPIPMVFAVIDAELAAAKHEVDFYFFQMKGATAF